MAVCPLSDSRGRRSNLDVLSIINVLWILGEGPEHHGLPWDVVAPVGLHQEVQCDLVEAREEVESESGTLSVTS